MPQAKRTPTNTNEEGKHTEHRRERLGKANSAKGGEFSLAMPAKETFHVMKPKRMHVSKSGTIHKSVTSLDIYTGPDNELI